MVQRLLSWPLAVGIGVGAGLAVGLGVGVGIGVGVAIWIAMGAANGAFGDPDARDGGRIDPFAVGEPWRQFVQAAQRATQRLHETVDGASDGPTKERLVSIVDRLDSGVDETWRIARRGHEIDQAVARLDPTSLRSRLETLRAQQLAAPSEDLDVAIASVESQLATTDRLKERSTKTANSLRLAQTRLDELV
ncbi:MAG: hypothetical protein AAGG08_12165, partial [Actinomycetota bacterium]